MSASRLRFAALFWGGLFLALAAVATTFRHRMPDPALCASQAAHPTDIGGVETLSLPVRMSPTFLGRSTQRFLFAFEGPLDLRRPVVLYAGEATPFVHVRVNGVEATPAVNLAGLPGLSLPVGFVGQRPVGLQLIGHYFAEDRLLNVAHRYQQVTDWHTRTPGARP